MSRLLLISFLFLFYFQASGQEGGQTVRGIITDADSHVPLQFANVGIFKDSIFIKGATTDTTGRFRMTDILPARYTIRSSYLGYNAISLRNIEVTSGKEVVLRIEMEESITEVGEVTVSGNRKEETINEMAMVSTRVFSAEESQRYAGSRSDIARMASNFAGVQGGDDSRNDIVIRGNSPLGVLWRVDDVDIPNPNHFSAPGTTGGPVSALNSKMFGSSDFMTGAFPAEYGNASAGVFDLKMRSGNNEKTEFTGQIGALGLELGAEGPMADRPLAPSYLLSYRYSTLDLFDKMNIPIGTSAVPHYQDGGLKLNFPGKKGLSNFSVFGIAGKSDIEIIQSKFTTPQENLYEDDNKDEYFGSSFMVGGANFSKSIGKKLFFKMTLSASAEEGHTHHLLVYRDSLFRLDSLVEKLRFKFITYKYSGAMSLTTKFNSRSTLKAGVFCDRYQMDYIDSIYHETSFVWEKRMDENQVAFLIQPYIQWRYKLSERFIINGGLHGQFFTLNNSFSIEPRLAVKWHTSDKQAISLGYGMHSRLLPLYLYLIRYPQAGGGAEQTNKNLDFLRAHHVVLTYDLALSQNSRLKAETYYQYLYNVPVNQFSSGYSMLNEGSSFDRIFPLALENKGTGQNYGLELTLERFFSQDYFVLLTGSLYNSTYRGSDNIERNTDFNGVFASNLVAGREFVLGKKKNKFFISDIKFTYAGGGRYTPPDIKNSALAGTLVEVDSLRNTKQFKNYVRVDLKVGLKLNSKKKISHEIAIDLINVFNTKNVLELSYAPNLNDPSANPLHEIYQLGRLPLFYYKVDF